MEGEVKIVKNLSEQLSNESIYDELTQLPTLPYVTNYVQEVLGATGKRELQAALCIFDIDHFKRYIDFHGRIEGEQSLQKVADCMKTVMNRQGILLSRFREAQFVCFLIDTDRKELTQLVETCRETIENQNLTFCWEQHSFQLTISVGGVHGLTSQFKDKEEMFAVAEEELFEAKTTGYNNSKIKFK